MNEHFYGFLRLPTVFTLNGVGMFFKKKKYLEKRKDCCQKVRMGIAAPPAKRHVDIFIWNLLT
jgi:hypothetical protein